MEKLELKQIVGYLPYGLKVMHTDFEPMEGKFTSQAKVETMGIECVTFENSFYAPSDYFFGGLDIEIKPILRPLSDLTKEIEFKGEKFVPVKKLGYNENWIGLKTHFENAEYLPYKDVQKLYEWHFDIHDLIGKDLAIDINTLTK